MIFVLIGAAAGLVGGVAITQPKGEKLPGLVLAATMLAVGIFLTTAYNIPH